MSGRPGSNRRHSAWKADALPTELLPHFSFNNLRLNLLELNLNIKIVKSNKLLNLRSKILRNNMNPSKCIFRGDDNKTSFHIGAYIDGILVGGVSIIKNKCSYKDFPNCYQLRGLFVDFNHQKKGIGKMIIEKVESLLKNKKVSYLWMNARVKALDFYLKLNYTNSEITYNMNEIGLHYMLYKKL